MLAHRHRRTRVLVTGMGVVSPIGCDLSSFWEAQTSLRCGVGPIEAFDASGYATTFAGAVDPDLFYGAVSTRVTRKVDTFVVMALAAAAQAVGQAGLAGPAKDHLDPTRVGVCLGTSSGPLATNYAADVAFHHGGQSGLRRALPYISTASSVAAASAELALAYKFKGPSLTVSAECSSGANAIGVATAMIRSGAAEVMLCGGVDATVNERSLAIMSMVGALSTRNDDPAAACRPFDRDRDGFVLGEGSGILVLESERSARSRGVDVLGEIAGYGAATDTHHATAPDPSGAGAVSAMRAALTDAELGPTDIGFVNAHATGTPLNDPIELSALRSVFEDRAEQVPIYGIKPLTGHMIAAAGAVEAIAALLSLRHRTIPATLNCDSSIDPEMDIVTGTARPHSADYGLSTSYGFGGQCAALVLAGPDRAQQPEGRTGA